MTSTCRRERHPTPHSRTVTPHLPMHRKPGGTGGDRTAAAPRTSMEGRRLPSRRRPDGAIGGGASVANASSGAHGPGKHTC